MSTTVGEAIIRLKFGDENLEKDLKETGSKINSVMGGVKKAGKIALAGATAAGVAIAGVGKQALDSYADYEQLVGGMDTLFKDASATVQQQADIAFKTADMSANEYMTTVTQFSASLIQSVGGDTAKAAKLADQAIIDMSDNANKMGTNIEDIQNAYRGFAKQNFTMLDNLSLGYGGTAKEMQRLLDDAEKLTGIKYDISSYADITEAVHAIQTEMEITGTTAKEASETISGSIASAKASFDNLLTAVGKGEGFETAFNQFIESVGVVIQNVAPLIPTIVQGITTLIQGIIPLLPQLIQQLVPPLLQGGIAIMSALVQALPQIMQALIDALPQIINSLVTFLTDPANIGAIIEASVVLFMGVVKAVPQILGGLFKAFGDLFGKLWGKLKGMFTDFAESFGEAISGVFKNAINGVFKFIENFINGPINAINGFINVINNAFGVVGVNIGHIQRVSLPRLAKGGFANGPTTAIIGEAGREAVLPLDQNTDNWSGLLAGALADEFEEMGGAPTGATYNITMNNNIDSDLDAEEIGRTLITSIRRAA